jgi:hypothetical protein
LKKQIWILKMWTSVLSLFVIEMSKLRGGISEQLPIFFTKQIFGDSPSPDSHMAHELIAELWASFDDFRKFSYHSLCPSQKTLQSDVLSACGFCEM